MVLLLLATSLETDDVLSALRLAHYWSPCWPRPKNQKPLQWLPVMALATALSDLKTCPLYAKPRCSTWTCSVSPLYFRVRIVPAGGKRLSMAAGSVAIGGWTATGLAGR